MAIVIFSIIWGFLAFVGGLCATIAQAQALGGHKGQSGRPHAYDNGPSKDFLVHRMAGAANIVGLENATNLEQLPATGAWVIVLPIKIANGSGAPARAIALVP